MQKRKSRESSENKYLDIAESRRASSTRSRLSSRKTSVAESIKYYESLRPSLVDLEIKRLSSVTNFSDDTIAHITDIDEDISIKIISEYEEKTRSSKDYGKNSLEFPATKPLYILHIL